MWICEQQAEGKAGAEESRRRGKQAQRKAGAGESRRRGKQAQRKAGGKDGRGGEKGEGGYLLLHKRGLPLATIRTRHRAILMLCAHVRVYV